MPESCAISPAGEIAGRHPAAVRGIGVSLHERKQRFPEEPKEEGREVIFRKETIEKYRSGSYGKEKSAEPPGHVPDESVTPAIQRRMRESVCLTYV